MEKVYFDTRVLDTCCRKQYGLSEELMMENAASALEQEVLHFIKSNPQKYMERASVLILAGTGNNGADGFALARRLIGKDISVTLCTFGECKTELATLQKKRAELLQIREIVVYELDEFFEQKSMDLRVIGDCIFGSGFHGKLPAAQEAAVRAANKISDVYKIACDIPSGLDLNGNCEGEVFCADLTVSMGSLKCALFSDAAKDACGKIVCANLGVSRSAFESLAKPVAHLLEQTDIHPPFRKKQNVHKGTFGHTVFVCGQKKGAAVLAASAALYFGAGLATLFLDELDSDSFLPPYLMSATKNFPENCKCLAFGMGLGSSEKIAAEAFLFLEKNPTLACVLDADIFYDFRIRQLLEKRRDCNYTNIVLTPHPKECVSLFKICGLGDFSVKEIVLNRMELAKKFVEKFPCATLLLKGANSIIATEEGVFINPLGNSALAKAGSGDVLTGLCAALLSQGYSAQEAAIQASLVHANASHDFFPNYALTPPALIEKIAHSVVIA